MGRGGVGGPVKYILAVAASIEHESQEGSRTCKFLFTLVGKPTTNSSRQFLTGLTDTAGGFNHFTPRRAMTGGEEAGGSVPYHSRYVSYININSTYCSRVTYCTVCNCCSLPERRFRVLHECFLSSFFSHPEIVQRNQDNPSAWHTRTNPRVVTMRVAGTVVVKRSPAGHAPGTSCSVPACVATRGQLVLRLYLGVVH